MSIEYDSSKAAWDNYAKIYKNSNVLKWFKYDKSELVCKNDRFHLKMNNNEEFKVSGDLIFNSNEKEGHYEYFFKQINRIADNKVKSEYIKKLEICKDCYKLENTALMITTGGLNPYKGRKGNNDRFDVFAYNMKLFMEEEGIEIGQNKQKYILMTFLKSKYFIETVNKDERIYLYFKDWYLIDDEKYVGRLIESGERRCKSSVPDEEDAKSYIDLALEYWEFRKNKYGG